MVGAGLLFLGVGTSARQQQQELPAAFGEVIDVRVVNIEVVVTDRNGNRVHRGGVGPG